MVCQGKRCGHLDEYGRLTWQTLRVDLDELLVDLPAVSDEETGIEISTDVISGMDVAVSMFSSSVGGGRAPREGDRFTRMERHGRLWMSDTRAERGDHIPVASRVRTVGLARLHPHAVNLQQWLASDRGRGLQDLDVLDGSVLIGGLGLGMILGFALLQPGITRVDVVELDAGTIRVVGGLYQRVAREHGVALTFHHADLMTWKPEKGARWDVAWFDIWPHLCTEDLVEHATLARRFSRRAAWYGCWAHEQLLAYRRRGGGWR